VTVRCCSAVGQTCQAFAGTSAGKFPVALLLSLQSSRTHKEQAARHSNGTIRARCKPIDYMCSQSGRTCAWRAWDGTAPWNGKRQLVRNTDPILELGVCVCSINSSGNGPVWSLICVARSLPHALRTLPPLPSCTCRVWVTVCASHVGAKHNCA
jgi:hypothetical protein